MKKTLSVLLVLALFLSLSACGGRTDPAPESTESPEPTSAPTAVTVTPTADPDPEPEGPDLTKTEERAVEYLRSRDYDYVVNNLEVYFEYYRLTHPGAEVYAVGYSAMYPHIRLDLAGADAKAFWTSGLLPDLVNLGMIADPQEYSVMDDFIQVGYPEAELLYEGLPENVEAAPVGRVTWPALSCRWLLRERLPEDPELQEKFWVRQLLGERAEFDEEAEVWRAGDQRLDVTNGAKLRKESKIARALELTLPLRQPDTLDPRDLPGLEESGWRADSYTNAGYFEEVPYTLDPRDIPSLGESGWRVNSYSNARVDYFEEVPFLYIYAQRQEEVTYAVGEGETLTDTLVTGGVFKTYRPEAETLNARLAAALAERRDKLGEEAFLAQYGDLTDFTFAPEDLEDVSLILAPIRASFGGFAFEYVSPWGEMEEAAAWCLYSRSLGLIALEAPLMGYTLEPWETEDADSTWVETRFPWRGTVSAGEESYRFGFSPEGGSRFEDLRFTGLRYVLTAGNDSFRDLRTIAENGRLFPVWLLEVEPAEGEAWSCSLDVSKKYGCDFYERCYIQLLTRKLPDLFAAYREQHPNADVWVSGWTVLRGEDGGQYVEVSCYGTDIPDMETSGYLPERVKLSYSEAPFNQKEAHPCPREPEWEKKYWSEEREDAVTLTMTQAVYPLYPEYVEVTVKCKKTFDRDWYRFSKYADGEWQEVYRLLSGTLQFLYVEAGETTLQVPTMSRLGPGLYRLYINQEYWVEFAVSAEASEP